MKSFFPARKNQKKKKKLKKKKSNSPASSVEKRSNAEKFRDPLREKKRRARPLISKKREEGRTEEKVFCQERGYPSDNRRKSVRAERTSSKILTVKKKERKSPRPVAAPAGRENSRESRVFKLTKRGKMRKLRKVRDACCQANAVVLSEKRGRGRGARQKKIYTAATGKVKPGP